MCNAHLRSAPSDHPGLTAHILTARRMGGPQRYPSHHHDRMAIWPAIRRDVLAGTASSSPSIRRQGDGIRKRSTHPSANTGAGSVAMNDAQPPNETLRTEKVYRLR